MSLPAPWPLSQIREEVLTRCTLNTGGDRGARASKLIDSFIRGAQAHLVLKAPWLQLSATRDITLLSGVSVYDFPDDLEPGRYMDVYVRNLTSGRFEPLSFAPSMETRNGYINSVSRPIYYWYEDEQIYVSPTPDITSWDIIRISGYLRDRGLINDTDLASVDGEALVQRAEISARPRLGLQVSPLMIEEHAMYVRAKRAAVNTTTERTMPGGDTSMCCAPQDGEGTRNWGGYAYDAGWQPQGYWG